MDISRHFLELVIIRTLSLKIPLIWSEIFQPRIYEEVGPLEVECQEESHCDCKVQSRH